MSETETITRGDKLPIIGKAAVSHLNWADVYAYASSLPSPAALPHDLESRINVSPPRLRVEGRPFAPAFMGAWSEKFRALVVVP